MSLLLLWAQCSSGVGVYIAIVFKSRILGFELDSDTKNNISVWAKPAPKKTILHHWSVALNIAIRVHCTHAVRVSCSFARYRLVAMHSIVWLALSQSNNTPPWLLSLKNKHLYSSILVCWVMVSSKPVKTG